MKKWIAKQIYLFIRKYIKVDSYKNPYELSLQFTLNIFGERVAEIEYSRYELVECRILK